ncbi:hypothetical protein AeNC1_018084 [Aphanomyces euteiches]|nr:hypothetical protein AeNC1_018084 [Aphanomyces euteiches]
MNGSVEIVANSEGARTTPSCVAFTDSARLIGESAVNQAAANAANTVFGVKRLIGCEFHDRAIQQDLARFPFTVTRRNDGKPQIEITYKGETKKFLPEEISAMVLIKMKEIAETFIEEPVKNAVITVPAYFSNSQRQSTKTAGAIAGLNVLRVVNEPTAAAMAYGFHKTDQERNVLIYDLGGGTFDVSVVVIEGQMFEVRAVAGNTHLGGDDFDNRLVDYFKYKFNDKDGKDLSQDQRAVRRLRTACEHAKRALSSSVKACIEIDSLFDGIDLHEVLTRATFEDLCRQYFKDTMECVAMALREAKIYKEDVHEVVLVADGQDSVTIKVFEGERLMARDNLFLGQFKLDGPRWLVVVRKLTLPVETSSGSEKKITITRDHVLTTEEIERMVQDAERYKAEDEANKVQIEAKNDLEGRAYAIRDKVQRSDLIMSNQDKEGIESMVTEVLGWLDDNQLAEKEAFQAKKDELNEYANRLGLS